jgi:hypothetical protein
VSVFEDTGEKMDKNFSPDSLKKFAFVFIIFYTHAEVKNYKNYSMLKSAVICNSGLVVK